MRPLRPTKDVIADWSPELSARLGRSTDDLGRRGLSAYDFPGSRSVEIRYPDGYVHRIALAFAVVRPAAALAAVFSEHAGYLEFDLVDDCVVAEIRDDIVYRHDAERVDG